MNLTKENYKLIAAKLYRNPILIDNEFVQDLKLLNNVVNRVRKFADTGELKVKLLYNHYTVACNCFGTDYVNKSLFLLADSAIENLLLTVVFAFSGNDQDIVVNDKFIISFDNVKILKSVVAKINKEIRE